MASKLIAIVWVGLVGCQLAGARTATAAVVAPWREMPDQAAVSAPELRWLNGLEIGGVLHANRPGQAGWWVGRCGPGGDCQDVASLTVTAEDPDGLRTPLNGYTRALVYVDGLPACAGGGDPPGVHCVAAYERGTPAGPPIRARWELTVSTSGQRAVVVRVFDMGWVEGRLALDIQADLVDPTAEARVTAGTADSEGIYRTPVEVTLTGTDEAAGSGLDHLIYRLDNSSDTTVASGAVVRVTTAGAHTLAYRAVDVAGRASAERYLPLRLDLTPPTVTLAITAICDDCAAGPVTLSGVTVRARSPALGSRVIPFVVTLPRGGRVNLTAPATASADGRALSLRGWRSVTFNRSLSSSATLIGTAEANETLAAVYRVGNTATLQVIAQCEGCTADATALRGVAITVSSPSLGSRAIPFTLAVSRDSRVTLAAPATATVPGPNPGTNRPLRFKVWRALTDGRVLAAGLALSTVAERNETLAAVFEPASPASVTLSVQTVRSGGTPLPGVPLTILSPCGEPGGCRATTDGLGRLSLAVPAGAVIRLRAPSYPDGSDQCPRSDCPGRFRAWHLADGTPWPDVTLVLVIRSDTAVTAEYAVDTVVGD